MAYEKVHQNPKGPGDARPTALDIVKDENLVGKLTGKTILITGGTSGLGLEAARALYVPLSISFRSCAKSFPIRYTTGAQIFITARNAEKGRQVARDIGDDLNHPVEVIEMELDSLNSVRNGALDFLKKSKGLNVLMCNAGVMSCPESRSQDGFETHFAVNHLSHFLLFQLLKDILISSSSQDFASRVVSLSSCAHRGGSVRFDDYNFEKESYQEGLAYGQAKTANIYFAHEVDRRYGSQHLHGLSVHPGFIKTPLLRHLAGNPYAEEFINNPKTANLWKTPEQGAATQVWAAIAKEWEGRGGRYLEDVGDAGPFDPNSEHPGHAPGYASYAYDQQASKRLWVDSLAMVKEYSS